MQIRRLRPEEDAVRRFVEQCWFPYHEDVSATVPDHTLADVDASTVVDAYLDLLDAPSARLWVALDGAETTASLTTTDATLAGFVRTRLAPSPPEFQWPDRLAVEDLWVRAGHRGSGVADDLLARVVQQAHEDGCTELTADVATENRRATAYAERHGFEARGLRMRVPVAEVTPGDGGVSAPASSVHLRRVRVEEGPMRRFVEDCWFPFWRALERAVGTDHLAPEMDRDALVEGQLEAYDTPDRRCWVALDDVADPAAPLAETDATVAGWLNAGFEPGDRFLDPPDRLFVGNIYAAPAYRGSGLADHLVRRAVQYAREEGCRELSLDVELDNERALAYYEKLGFEPHRQRMVAPLDAVDAAR